MSQNAAIPSLLPVYSRIDLAFERGEGCWLFSRDGRRFLDFTTGIAVNGLGHCHPHLVKALQDQAAKLWHVSNLYRIEQLERLADRLVAHSFAETVFVGNSGAEAMEACIKMARRFQWHRGQGERNRIVTFEGA
ncbi:MAG: aminotransferase class III-fold pyridoxal phosphate-dependent enzyme, partial [Geminicoccaceae bacterium]